MLEREIFDAALNFDDPVEQSRFIDEACGDDSGLRDHLRGLLDAHENLGDFLASPPTLIEAIGDNDTLIADRTVEPTVDSYKLVKQVGHGGMGVVYLAEQLQPVRRQVALKIVKAGMDSQEVVTRFAAERQALAMMDHPNIAQVFDGGTTDQGYPYFAMELVHGQPITDYCDQHESNTDDRLVLFGQVCRGVQHAHQKGIIHRDIKPSNTIVVERDGVAIVKVIDFGIAKAIQSDPTEAPLVTTQGQWIGTPAYMSPEQAGLGGLDVDMRSDVYSLGVLLYELLSGATPLDATRIKGLGLVELQHLIQEEAAIKPSAIHATLSSELDWIVLRAIEKDRQRRYQSVAELAQDIDRYLANQPVSACPPSVIYTARKYVKRNLVPLSAATVAIAALIIGTSVSIWQTIVATEAANQAEVQQRRAERHLAEADKLALLSEQNRARAENNLLKSFTVANLIDDELKDRDDTEILREELLTATLDHFDRIFADVDLNQDHLRQLASVYERSATLRQKIGTRHHAIVVQNKSLEIYKRLLIQNPEDLGLVTVISKIRINIAYNLKSLNQVSEGIMICEEEIAHLQPLVIRHPAHRGLKYQLSRAYNNAGAGYGRLANHRQAQRMLELALPLRIQLARETPSLALGQLYNDIGFNQLNLRNYKSALTANRRALSIRREILRLAPASKTYRGAVAASHNHIGDVYRAMKRYDESLQEYDKSLEIEEQLLVENQNRVEFRSRLANSYDNQALALHGIGKHEQALFSARQSLNHFQVLSEQHPHWRKDSADVLNSIAKYFLELDQIEEARDSVNRSIELLQSLRDQRIGDAALLDHQLQETYGTLVDVEIKSGELDQAEAIIRKRWKLVADQPSHLHSIVLSFGRLATAADKAEPDPEQAEFEHDRYVNLAAQALRQALPRTATEQSMEEQSMEGQPMEGNEQQSDGVDRP